MRVKITFKKKTLEERVKEVVSRFSQIIEEVSYSENQFSIVLKSGQQLTATEVDALKTKLGARFHITITEVA